MPRRAICGHVHQRAIAHDNEIMYDFCGLLAARSLPVMLSLLRVGTMRTARGRGVESGHIHESAPAAAVDGFDG